MNVWLVTIGEPIPISFGVHDRLLRTGSFASFLAANEHDVNWWTSSFDHFRKKHFFDEYKHLDFKDHFKINFIHGCGYKSNVSFKRLLDHYLVGKKFAEIIRREKRKPDIIVTSLPTIDLCYESVKYGRECKVPVVLDMRDMWPDILIDTFPGGIRVLVRCALSPVFRKARWACEGATAITGITDAFLEWGLKKADREKSSIDRSFPLGYRSAPPLSDDLKQAEMFWDEKEVLNKNHRFNVCFFGNLGRQLDVETIILAARKIQKRGIPIYFILCGSGDRLEYYRRMAGEDENIILPGRIDAAQIYALMQRSFIGLDPLPDRYDFLATINNKAIEYFSAALPVISSPEKGILAELLEKHQCGMSYPANDPDSLADRLLVLYHDRDLLNKMSNNAAIIFRDKFTAERVNMDMMRYLEDVVSTYESKNG